MKSLQILSLLAIWFTFTAAEAVKDTTEGSVPCWDFKPGSTCRAKRDADAEPARVTRIPVPPELGW